LLEGDVGILPVLLMAALAMAGSEEPRRPEVTLDIDSLSSNPERPVRGSVIARCGSRGSVLEFDLAGLEPDGQYSIWVFLFERPTVAVVSGDAVAAGALGGGRGTRHEFAADRRGGARFVVLHRAGPLSAFGSVAGCLLDAPQWRLVGGLHPRGVRAGVHMPPPGEIVAQFGVTYRRRQGS
jgi:hypothetical protein